MNELDEQARARLFQRTVVDCIAAATYQPLVLLGLPQLVFSVGGLPISPWIWVPVGLFLSFTWGWIHSGVNPFSVGAPHGSPELSTPRRAIAVGLSTAAGCVVMMLWGVPAVLRFYGI